MKKCGITTANKLFDRFPDPLYLEECTRQLAQPQEVVSEEVKESSFVVFRLSNEWFGLSALVFSEIATMRAVNILPHKMDPILLGVVNLRGQLCISFSLHVLLGLDEKEQETKSVEKRSKIHYSRLIAISYEKQIFTFPVDDVDSVFQFDLSKMMNVPVNISHSKENFLKGVVILQDKRINIINEEILFSTLLRRLS